MDKNELSATLSSLKPENYIASEANIQKGVFRADLRARSLHSDGKMSVEKLLDEVVAYANTLSEKNGSNSKFIFALSDHDSVEGVQEAVKLIAQNPDKYKNIRFVPAVELGFVHAADKSANSFEVSEIVAYGIDPFSEKLTGFLNSTYEKRAKFVESFIKSLNETNAGATFSVDEFAKAYGINVSKIHKNNIHWDLFHYGNTKKAYGTSAFDKKYADFMSQDVGGAKSLWDMKQKAHVYMDEDFAEARDIREAMKPKLGKDGLISNLSENRFEEVIGALDETQVVIGLAHPYYLADSKVSNVGDFVSGLIKKAKGMFKMTESYHQSYNGVAQDKILNVNSILENLGLKPFGARDIQGNKFI